VGAEQQINQLEYLTIPNGELEVLLGKDSYK
jgi:hypothetical protein